MVEHPRRDDRVVAGHDPDHVLDRLAGVDADLLATRVHGVAAELDDGHLHAVAGPVRRLLEDQRDAGPPSGRPSDAGSTRREVEDRRGTSDAEKSATSRRWIGVTPAALIQDGVDDRHRLVDLGVAHRERRREAQRRRASTALVTRPWSSSDV